jgi:molybdate transport system substrate-binding protein
MSQWPSARLRGLWARLARVLLLAAPALTGHAQDVPTVAAAANLKGALETIVADYRADTGASVRLIFGATGNFVRQIEQGAPFAIFLAADEASPQRLVTAGRTAGPMIEFATGRLALIVPKGSPLGLDGSLQDLKAALNDGRLKRFAIANPEHAPYGQRAVEAFHAAGLWPAIQPRLVMGENVAQAAQFATSGNAQGGLVAYSLALAPELAARADHALVPATLHSPLRQGMVLLKGAGPEAQRFYAYLQAPKARATLRRHGFGEPGGG